MYTKWRPIPSARTVRMLYQLGYICSGTACGLATLCLEEQRRRIKVLQKIADNAKIIRQHPRYRGNAALATTGGGDAEGGGVESEWMYARLPRRRTRRLEGVEEAEHGAVQDSHLPSGVDREHDKLCGERSVREHSVNSSLFAPSDGPYRHARERREQYVRRIARPEPIAAASRRDIQPTNPSYISNIEQSVGPQGLQEEVSGTSPDSPLHQRAGSAEPIPPAAQEVSENSHETFQWTPPSQIEISGDSHGDVHRFLQTARSDVPGAWDVRTCNELLRRALRMGSLAEIRSLCLWKLSNNTFSEADAQSVCGSCDTLRELNNHKQLYDFYAMMVRSARFSVLGANTQLACVLGIARNVAESNLAAEPWRACNEMLESCLRGSEDDVVAQALKRECKDLILRGKISVAARFFGLVAEKRTHALLLVTLADDIFDAATKSGHFLECAWLMRWKARNVGLTAIMPQVDPLINACGNWKNYDVLVDLFNPKTGLGVSLKQLLKAIYTSNTAILTIAFGIKARQGTFQQLYRNVPESLRTAVDETLAIETAKATWSANRNLEDFDARVSKVMRTFKESGDESALQKLQEATIEIYVRAGKLRRALKLVARMNKSRGVSSIVVLQTALLFAKQQSWDSLSRLIDMMKGSKRGHLEDAQVKRTFNAIIAEYSRHHTSSETWNFVASAMSELNFKPNHATTEIVLLCFVSNKTFDLLPAWIEFLKDQGHSNPFDAKMASDLLRRYYVDQRPSHIVTMRLCRKLVAMSPSLMGEDIVQLIRQTIAYDLRHLSGQNELFEEVCARDRLKRLEEAKPFIPSPGVAWDDRVYVHDAERVRARQVSSGGSEQPQSLEADHEKPESSDAESPNTLIDSDPTTEPVADVEAGFDPMRITSRGSAPRDHQSGTENVLYERQDKKLQGEMWLHMSLGRYQEAIDLYYRSLDAADLPAAPVILELAVEASLRLHRGDRSVADDIVAQARHAGMNTTCAMGPLLIYDMKHFDPQDKMAAARLQRTVKAYYHMNEQNGWPVMHYVGVNAAHVLITNRSIEQGLDILSSIYHSEHTKHRPLDIVAMTVFLKGYIAKQSLAGIEWVVQTLLDQNIRITKTFVRQLKWIVKGSFKWMDKHPVEVHPQLTSWVQLCRDRRMEQKAEAEALGWKLITYIAKATNDSAAIDVDVGSDLEDESLAEDIEDDEGVPEDFVDSAYHSDETEDKSEKSRRLVEIKMRMAEDWKAEQEFRRRMRSTPQWLWDSHEKATSLEERRNEDHEQGKAVQVEEGIQSGFKGGVGIFKPF